MSMLHDIFLFMCLVFFFLSMNAIYVLYEHIDIFSKCMRIALSTRNIYIHIWIVVVDLWNVKRLYVYIIICLAIFHNFSQCIHTYNHDNNRHQRSSIQLFPKHARMIYSYNCSEMIEHLLDFDMIIS